MKKFYFICSLIIIMIAVVSSVVVVSLFEASYSFPWTWYGISYVVAFRNLVWRRSRQDDRSCGTIFLSDMNESINRSNERTIERTCRIRNTPMAAIFVCKPKPWLGRMRWRSWKKWRVRRSRTKIFRPWTLRRKKKLCKNSITSSTIVPFSFARWSFISCVFPLLDGRDWTWVPCPRRLIFQWAACRYHKRYFHVKLTWPSYQACHILYICNADKWYRTVVECRISRLVFHSLKGSSKTNKITVCRCCGLACLS